MAQVEITYYDSLWKKTDKEHASTSVERNYDGTAYHYKSYNLLKKYLTNKYSYADSGNSKPIGYFVRYNQNGTIADSAFYLSNHKKLYAYHYYENGKLKAEYHYNAEKDSENVIGYNEDGSEIKGNFIYEKEATFPGSMEGWKKHLYRHLNANVPVINRAPDGKYTVYLRFIVDKDGSLSNIEALNRVGYGMEKEAIRVLKLSPNWEPAVQFNRAVKAYRKQPITFVVQ